MRTNIRLPELLDQTPRVIAQQVLTALLAQQAFAIKAGNGGYGQCQYTTAEGYHCAVGLALPDNVTPHDGSSASYVCEANGWATEARRSNIGLLATLQALHDGAARILGLGNTVLSTNHMRRLLTLHLEEMARSEGLSGFADEDSLQLIREVLYGL